uniref:Secreted protein n=1 Tax=Brassica campestris TaxID=3711 RepID=M4C9P5_BRACM
MSRCRFRLLLVITIVPVDIRVAPGSHANEHSGKEVRSWLISCKSIDDMSSDKLCSCVLSDDYISALYRAKVDISYICIW